MGHTETADTILLNRRQTKVSAQQKLFLTRKLTGQQLRSTSPRLRMDLLDGPDDSVLLRCILGRSSASLEANETTGRTGWSHQTLNEGESASGGTGIEISTLLATDLCLNYMAKTRTANFK